VIDLLPPRSRIDVSRGPARPTAKPIEALEALLLIVPLERAPFDALPGGAALAREHARRPRSAGATYSATIGATRVFAGVLGANATPFQRLALAGRLAKELAAHAPGSVGIAALVDDATGVLEATLAAVLAAAEPAPAARSRPSLAWAPNRVVVFGDADVAHVAAVEAGARLTRWLTALPPNVLTPRTYRTAVARLARARGWRVRTWDEAALKREGCGAFLAVVRGSAARDAAIVRVQYRPRGAAARARPIALVGKGLCFDTGGTNLKPAKSMLDMHADMGGSATALGILDALTALRFPVPVDAWLALAENRIGPSAYTQNEVVTAANGTTIQVMHTDAEGRMALADTLALAARSEPAAIVDFATLTGACVSALTERMSGVFTNRPELRDVLEQAGHASGERVWTFPTPPDYDDDLESGTADVLQCLIDGKGDHIYAARFLGRFVPDALPWVHVDLSSAHRPGGLAHVNSPFTGFGVRFGAQLLLDGFGQSPARPTKSTRGSRR
jgi:leucyl aminopeptidase